MLRKVEEKFSEGQWKGRRAFIVGGGPSLNGFPFHRLEDELVVAVNKSHECGVADVIFTGDRRWLDKLLPRESAPRDIPLVYAVRGRVKGKLRKAHRIRDIYTMGVCEKEDRWGLTFDEGVARGCSGLRAANFAAMLGANPIYLLGIDMGPDPRARVQEWWHEGYPTRGYYRNRYSHFMLAWDAVAKSLKRQTEIINLSPISTLDCFPKQDWKEVLNATPSSDRSRPLEYDCSTGASIFDLEILP